MKKQSNYTDFFSPRKSQFELKILSTTNSAQVTYQLRMPLCAPLMNVTNFLTVTIFYITYPALCDICSLGNLVGI